MGHAKLYGSRSRYPRVALASDALTQQFHNPLPKIISILRRWISSFVAMDLSPRKSGRYPALVATQCYDLLSVVRLAIPEANPTRVLRDKLLRHQNRCWRRRFGAQLQPG